jgi:ketosteroid isomerase-like protein
VHKEVQDVEARTCMMHASSTANTKKGPYANEYALILTFTNDGKKIEKIEEFADSAYSKEFFAKLQIPT